MMLPLFLASLVFSILATIGAVPQRLKPQCRSNICDDRPECPKASCTCLFASRKDCAIYYHCVNGKPFQYRCSPGLLFNAETLSCDYSYLVNCSSSTTVTTSTVVPTTEEPTTTIKTTKEPTTIKTTKELTTTIKTTIQTVSTPGLPSSDFLCPTRFGLFPDPKSCFRFYHCSHWIPYHKWCPSNLHFNPKLKVCDWPYRAGCDTYFPTPSEPNNPTPSEPNSSTTTIPTPTPNSTHGTCDCDCCTLPVPTDCNAFVSCIDKVAFLMHCSPGLYFNPMTGTCDYRENVVCHKDDFTCPEPPGRYLLPDSCSYFVECHDGEKTIKQCPEGLQFNQSSEMCSWLGSCSGHQPDDPSGSGIIIDNTICNGCDYCFKPLVEDCSRYVKCHQNTATVERCAAGLFFNAATEMCDHDYNVECPEPQPQPVCPQTFGYFPYPGECGMYLQCINGDAIVRNCPGILHFDPVKKHCDYPWAAGCSDPDAEPTPEPIPETLECDCDCCLKQLDRDCRSFVLCVNKVGFVRSCSSGLHFNPRTENCDFAENVNCSIIPEIPGYYCPEHQGLFPHPEDCHKFIHCAHGYPYVKDCPSNLHFNPKLKVCDWPYSAGCQDSQTTDPPPDVNDLPCDVCDSCFIPDETDCASYIYCRNGKGHRLRCTENLVFNPDTEACDLLNNVNCPNKPPSECLKPEGLFPAKDCSQFIHCSNGIAFLKDCPEGLQFNPLILVCDLPENVKCGEIPVEPTPLPDDDSGASNRTCNCDCCFLPNKNDCSKYILCLDGYTHVGQCPRGLLFNPGIQNCDLAERVTCGDISPLCPEPNGLFPNLDQCSSYLKCSGGASQVEYCQNGTHFSVEKKQCLDPCKAKCDSSYDCGRTPGTTPPSPAPSTPDPQCLNWVGLFPAEEDCSSFYQCSGGKAYLRKCPAGLHFSYEQQACEYPCEAKCDSSIDCSPTTTPDSDCLHGDGLLPAEGDCSSFYLCSGGISYLIKCPQGLDFSYEHQVCEYPCKARCNSSIDCSPSTTPSPSTPDSRCIQGDGLFPEEGDCSSFYQCSEGRSYLMKCPPGLHFSYKHQACEYPCEAKCDPSIDCSPTTTPSPSSPSPQCIYGDGLFPSKGDCTSFYLCSGGSSYLIKCPPGLHFSHIHQVCEYPCEAKCDSSIDCSPSTTPSPSTPDSRCIQGDGLFPDEEDCSSFYQCSEGISYLMKCPPDLHFSYKHQACEYPCEAKCNSSIDCSPTTTPTPSSPSPQCLYGDGLFPSIGDCSSFYLCSGGSSYLIKCPSGLHFSYKHQACEYPCVAKCDSSIDCSPTTTPLPSTPDSRCLNGDGLFPEEGDCSSFYQCLEGRSYHMKCPPGLHFSYKHQACEYPCEAKCDSSIDCSPTTTPSPSSPSPQCIYGDGLFPSKGDCTSFYLCSGGSSYLIKCPPGLHFSHIHQVCEYPCEAKCDSSIDCSPTTTPLPSTPDPRCLNGDGLFPEEGDCSSFYQCSEGRSYLMKCPPDLHFSYEHQACDYPCEAKCDSSIDCSPTTTPSPPSPGPQCIYGDGLFPSKEDCSSFYLCSGGSSYLLKCAPGLHFSHKHEACEYPCVAMCDTSIDCSTTTPKPVSTPSPDCPTENGIFPVLGDCAAFYICSNGKKYLIPCPPGQHYSIRDEICENPCDAECDVSSDCEASTEPVPSSTTPHPISPECHEPDGLFPNPDDCGSFYQCSNGRSHLVQCPSDLHFSPDDDACERPCVAGCDISIDCPPEFPDADGNCTCDACYLPDPSDCSAFYFCDNLRLAKGYCPYGTLFNKVSSVCEDENIVDCEANGDPSMCPEPFGFFPYPGDCKKFVHCDNSVAHVKECEGDLEYDPLSKVCTKPKGYCGETTIDPNCLQPTGMFPDPTNCSLFYHCEHGVAYPKRCPLPLLFNPDRGVCDWPENVDCGRGTTQTPTPSIKPNYTTPIPTPSVPPCYEVPGVVCPCACRVPTYDECSSYFQCQEDGTACKRYCPDGLYFNNIEMVCDLPQNVKCRDFFLTSIRRAKQVSHRLHFSPTNSQ